MMDKIAIKSIMDNECLAIRKLLGLMDDQYEMLLKNDLFALEDIVEKIRICNKEIAEAEVERRKLVNGVNMNSVIAIVNEEGFEKNFRNIKMLLNEIKVQKDTNEMLIRQGLGFSTRMLNILNPNRNTSTYNSYGRIAR